MDTPDYLIINPLQLELLLAVNINASKKETIDKEKKTTIIDKRFNEKMEKLKNISLETRRLKHMISHINHKTLLVDI